MNRSAEHGAPAPCQFLGKRAMSALGIVPLGLYVVMHLWTNLSSLGGPAAFDLAVRQSRHHPAFVALEVLLGLAILVHAVFGVQLLLRWRPSRLAFSYFRNFKFLLHRIAGLGAGLFIVAHVVKARVLPALSPVGIETFHGMREALSEPLTLSVYVLGLLGVSFHLANGLWTCLITWGLTVTPGAQRTAQWVSLTVFAVLLAMSGLSIYGFLRPSAAAYVVVR